MEFKLRFLLETASPVRWTAAFYPENLQSDGERNKLCNLRFSSYMGLITNI